MPQSTPRSRERTAVERLAAALRRARQQEKRLRRKATALGRENRKLRAEVARLRRENQKLKGLLEEARRAAKRQAAPFSRNKPKQKPKRPGRKPGEAYGPKASRPIPKHVDEEVDVPMPQVCPCCGGLVEEDYVEEQYQTDIPKPIRARVTRFHVHTGRCKKCRRKVQGRDPRQTSDALYAANNQIGPNALALAAEMNKALGVSYGRLVVFFRVTFELVVAKATLVRGVERLAVRTEVLYQQITVIVRQSRMIYPDETGWRIGGRGAWLWDFVCEAATLYVIRESRGFDVIEEILGAEYDGFLGCDGWAPYQSLKKAQIQTCLAHLLRRCDELLEMATRGAVRFPRAVKAILLDALDLRNRYLAGEVSEHGLLVALGRLEARLERLLHESRLSNADNRRFAKHLRNHEDEIFRFLRVPGLEATNWPAEQEIRPAVVNRKMSAGNRSDRGAHAQEVLASVIRTAERQGLDPVDILVRAQRATSPEEMPRFTSSRASFGGPHAPPSG